MEKILRFIEKLTPKPIYRFLQPFYHQTLAYTAAFLYGFPSRKLKVIGVTGTNGKSTVVHMITSILEEVGEKVVSVSSLRLKVGKNEIKDALKRTMPGRFVIQKLLRRGVDGGCKYAVVEVTSQGIEQFRHKGINFLMAVLTNVTPEHIESHGTFQKYREAKTKLFYKTKIHVLNGDDKENLNHFSDISSQKRIIYSKNDLPKDLNLKLLGEFNKENAAAAFAVARELGISEEKIKSALEKIESIPGRLEFVQKKPFAVVVDYAHTPDALRKVYQTLSPRLICVFGAAGGGRDKWKRPEMGKIASEFCDEIILTNEDPYDENPESILKDIEKGINPCPGLKKILDRRQAINKALKSASSGDTVIITGKGAEQWIMGPNSQKIPWDDRNVVKEELSKL
ncbi:MAG TPA: UDP-N-acetylmuramoyl-L-alanyl-D-glutamate--2,6-diaminopimelate ligase [Candidatus Paceibacterota bacterium]